MGRREGGRQGRESSGLYAYPSAVQQVAQVLRLPKCSVSQSVSLSVCPVCTVCSLLPAARKPSQRDPRLEPELTKMRLP